MTVSIDTFLPRINRECPGLPVFTARDEILRACREFCSRTQIWKETLDPMPAIANLPEYDIEVSSGTECVLILSMRQGDGTNNRLIYPKTEDQLDNERSFWRDLTGDQAECFVQQGNTTFLLVPYPETTILNSISDIRIAVKPAMDATVVADILYTDYEEEITDGALARLQMLPNKPWTNPDFAVMHLNKFEYAISQSRIRSRKSYSRANLYAQANERFAGP